MTAKVKFHDLVGVPAGNGIGMVQGRMGENLLISQNGAMAQNKAVLTWRLILLPLDQPLAPQVTVCRYLTKHGETCECGINAFGSVGWWEGNKLARSQSYCQGCMERALEGMFLAPEKGNENG